jgi:hypothetical protein
LLATWQYYLVGWINLHNRLVFLLKVSIGFLAVKTHSCCLSNYGVRVDRFLFKGTNIKSF